MPPIPPEQCSPFGPHNDGRSNRGRDTRSSHDDITHSSHATCGPPASPHLTIKELAERWKRKPKTIERHYAEWGLIPLRFGGRLLFPIEQVLEAERRAMVGQLVIGAAK